MTARPLPEAVERRLQAALLDAYNHGWAVGARVKAPVGPDNHEAALRAAIRAALDERGEVSPAAGASAAAMAPGEPVASESGELQAARVTFYEAARAYVEAKVEGTPHGCTYLDLKRAHDSLLAAERADRKGGSDAR